MSKRKLGPGSTATWPQPTYLEADAQPLTPGVPTYARIPIYPFEHVFRAGSSIRISVEAPVGMTGTFGFLLNPSPAINTVWHDQSHVSEWVFNSVPTASSPQPLPACGSVVEEPCRTNTEPVPTRMENGRNARPGALTAFMIRTRENRGHEHAAARRKQGLKSGGRSS
jgi:hypothetical protein